MEQLTELLRRHCSTREKLRGVEKKWHKMSEDKVSYKKEEGKVCYKMGEEFSSQLDCDIPGVQIRQETELGYLGYLGGIPFNCHFFSRFSR